MAIKQCGCTAGPNGVKLAAQFQDQLYGVGKRIHTVGNNKIRCSVCGKETQGAPSGETSSSKKGKR